MTQGAPASGYQAFAVTPSDTTQVFFNGLYVGGTGNITIENTDGSSCLISTIPAGTQLPFAGRRVMATGTTATLIVAML
jgi:hypothetical protein